jgi:hypothetical protein
MPGLSEGAGAGVEAGSSFLGSSSFFSGSNCLERAASMEFSFAFFSAASGGSSRLGNAS